MDAITIEKWLLVGFVWIIALFGSTVLLSMYVQKCRKDINTITDCMIKLIHLNNLKQK